MEFRYCSKCLREFPLNETCFNYTYRGGARALSNRCRSCDFTRKARIEGTPRAQTSCDKQYLLENPPPAVDRFKPCPPKINVPEQKGIAHVLFNVWRTDETVPPS